MIVKETKTFELDVVVKNLMSLWLQKPRHTKALLSRLSNFRRAALTELENGKTSLLNIHPGRVLKLISVLENSDLATAYEKYKKHIQLIEGRSGPLQSEYIDVDLSANKKFTDSFVEAMKNPVALAIYTLASAEDGVLDKDIKILYGITSRDIVEDLLEKKILVKYGKFGDRYFAINREMIHLNNANVRDLIPAMNSFYKSTHSGKNRNYIHFRVDSISQEALDEIYWVYAEMTDKVNSILGRESSKGKIPFYGFAQMDTFKDDID